MRIAFLRDDQAIVKRAETSAGYLRREEGRDDRVAEVVEEGSEAEKEEEREAVHGPMW